MQRDLQWHGVHCDVVSPSSIPSPRGKAVKIDRIDAGYLAQFYANGLLTIVQPPEAEQERDRDLLRSRQKLLQQQTQLREHLQSVLRRNGLHVQRLHRLIPALRAFHHVGSGLHYQAESGNKSHWTKHHYGWLARTIEGLSGSLKVNLELLLRQIKGCNQILAE